MSETNCGHRPMGRCLRCLTNDAAEMARSLAVHHAEQEADTGEIVWKDAPATEAGLYLYREGSGVTSFDKWTLCLVFLSEKPGTVPGTFRELRLLTPPACLGSHPVPTSGQFAGPLQLEGFRKGQYLTRAKAGGQWHS